MRRGVWDIGKEKSHPPCSWDTIRENEGESMKRTHQLLYTLFHLSVLGISKQLPKRTEARKSLLCLCLGNRCVCPCPCLCVSVCGGGGGTEQCSRQRTILGAGLLLLCCSGKCPSAFRTTYVLQASQPVSLQTLGSLPLIPFLLTPVTAP